MRPLTLGGIAAASGGVLGVLSRFVATGDERRAMTALVAAFGVAACVASACTSTSDATAARLRCGAGVALAAFVAAWAAAAAAGSPSLLGAAAVVAGGAALAFGTATLLRSRDVGAPHAVFLGAAVPALAAASLFVADPFIEWNGSTTAAAPARAAFAVSTNPVASIGADAGVDWQRSTWLYAGPTASSPGLSVTGQYYPSRPTPPATWGLAAAAIGFAALAAARPRARLSA